MKEGRILKTIFFTIFIDLVGYGILIPVIPELFANPASASYLLPYGTSVNNGYLLLGLLVAVFPLGQFFATPLLGQLSDRYGRKPVLLISILGTSISYVLFAIGIITKNIPLLFAARFFDGMTGGNISVAQATIADITTKENRSKNFGMIGAAFGLGFIFGPYIGGKLADPHLVSWFTAATPFWCAALLALLNVIFISKFLPETNLAKKKEKIIWSKAFKNIQNAFTNKTLKPLFITNFLFTSGFTFFTTFFSVFLISRFGFRPAQIGNFFAVVGICSVFTQAVVTRFLSKKFSEEKILSFSFLGTSLIMLLFFLPKAPFYLYLIVPFFSVCNGLSMANMTGLISRRASNQTQGEVLGLNASILALGQCVPALLSGVVAEKLSPSAPLFFSSALIFLGWFFFVTKGKIFTDSTTKK